MIENLTNSINPEHQKLNVIKDYSNLATITVTFNPNITELKTQLAAIPESSIKIIVDNASSIQHWKDIQTLSNRFKNIHLLRNETNLGLAAAINSGAKFLLALEKPPEFVLLLDQDSEPQPESIPILLSAFKSLQESGHTVGCVGPLLVDLNTGLNHGFHQCTKFRWVRAYPDNKVSSPIKCANINGSGTLMALDLFQCLGGLDEQLFIDHVDTEWSFRVIENGYELWGIPEAIFNHSMGETSIRIWLFGWRVWPVRSPKRHYFLFRNAVMLMQRSYIPSVWKIWAIVKLILTVGIVTISGPSRVQQIKNMWQGIKIGFYNNAN